MALIEQLAKQQEITLSNIKSQGKNKISVTLTNVSFNTAVRWLDMLQTQQHIGISQLNVEAIKNGLTNITVIITH
jgi:type II secretory pathway component PulM